MDDHLDQLRQEAEDLKVKIKGFRDAANDFSLARAVADVNLAPIVLRIRARRTFRGHLGKVTAMHWSADNQHFVAALLDGKLIVWDAYTSYKRYLIDIQKDWVTTCAYAPSGKHVACGGFGTTLYIFELGEKGASQLTCELKDHTSFISSCEFTEDNRILTSGDTECILWDIERKEQVAKFEGQGVTSLSVNHDKKTFISGAADKTAKLWDINTKKCIQTFDGHQEEINAVSWFPSGYAFATGSDDKTCRLFDTRANQELAVYCHNSGIASVAFSNSGRLLFAGDDDGNCNAWDSMRAERAGVFKVSILRQDSKMKRVSCLGVTGDGQALCTGSWGSFLKLWN